jgi:hypothetical protein
MKIAAALLSAFVLFSSSPLRAAQIKTPEEQFKAYPNRLVDLPPGWATTKPIRLQVCFNLKYLPNSPEANKFLRTWYRSIKAMPFGVKLRMERVVFPVKYAYCASLTFKNWANNRAYETSEVFLNYYRTEWKPAVTEAQEQMTILDTDVIPR